MYKELDFEQDREQLEEIEKLVFWHSSQSSVTTKQNDEGFIVCLIILEKNLHICGFKRNQLGNLYLHRCFILDGDECWNEIIKRGGWF